MGILPSPYPLGRITRVVETYVIFADFLSASGENYRISVSYGLEAGIPEGAELAVSEITGEGSGSGLYGEYLAKAKDALDGDEEISYARFFDISILDKDGEKVEIAAPVEVEITLADKTEADGASGENVENAAGVLDNEQNSSYGNAAIAENGIGSTEGIMGSDTDGIAEGGTAEKAQVIHFESLPGGEVPEILEDVEENGGTLNFETDSFSVFAVVYTVDFAYEDPLTHKTYTYNLEGGSEMLLSELFAYLDIEADLAGSTAAFSEDMPEGLVALAPVYKEGGGIVTDWLLTSLAPFSTQHTLTVTLADGTEINIIVTDDTGNADEGWNYSPNQANPQIKWRKDGTCLEIEAIQKITSPTTELADFGQFKKPWALDADGSTPNDEGIESVKVSGPFEVIPPRLLQTMKNIKTVDLSGITGGITNISYYAFYGCSSLEYVIMPDDASDTLKEIGPGAFRDCSKLKEIEMPAEGWKSLEYIGNTARDGNYSTFQGCTELRFDFSTCVNLKVIGNRCFQGCDALTVVDLSNCKSLEKIGHDSNGDNSTFYNCKNLKTVDLSGCENLTTISKSTFHSCTNLETVNFEGCKALSKIGEEAFLKCSNLQIANFNGCENLIKIGDEAFRDSCGDAVIDLSDCEKLEEIGANALQHIGRYYGTHRSSTDPVSEVGGVVLPKLSNIRTIGNNAFDETTLDLSAMDGVLDFSGNTKLTTIGSSAFKGIKELRKIDLSGCTALTKIGFRAFSSENVGNRPIYATSVDLSGAGAESGFVIENEAFKSQSNLTSVDLSNSNISAIGSADNNQSGAFEGCTALSNVELGGCDRLTSIGKKAFYNNYALSLLDLSDCTALTTIGEQAFSGSKSNKVTGDPIGTLVIPEGVTSIAAGALTGCKDITVLEWNAKNYTNDIASGTFPFVQYGETVGTGQNDNRFDLKVGGTAERLPGNFFYYLNNAGDIYFDGGENGHLLTVHINKTHTENVPEPLQYIGNEKNGQNTESEADVQCFVDPSGVLYELFDNGGTRTARIVYCPPELASYTVPETVETVNGNYTVTEVGKSAFTKAKDLASITFETSENITKIDEKAFYGLNTLAFVNGQSTVQNAKNSFANAKEEIANNAFLFTGLEDDTISSKAPSTKQTEKEYTLKAGKATVTLTINDNSFPHLDADPATGNKLTESDLSGGKKGTLHFLTGESLILDVAARTDDSSKGATVRVYFEFSQPGYTISPALTKTTDPNVYYYEFDVKTGETDTKSLTWAYPSPATHGGGVKAWLEVYDGALSGDQKAAEATAGKPAAGAVPAGTGTEEGGSGEGDTSTIPTSTLYVGKEYVDADWTTARRERKLSKSGTPQVVGIEGNAGQSGKNLYPLSVSAWDITMAYNDNGRANSGNGSDYVRSASFTDKLALPLGIEWDPEIIAALQSDSAASLTSKASRTDSRFQQDVYLGNRKVLYLNFPDTDTLKDVSLSLDGDDNVIISWTLKEMSGTKELSNLPVKMGLFEGSLVMDIKHTYLSKESGENTGNYKLAAKVSEGARLATEDDFPLRFEDIKNSVDVELFYTHTGSQELLPAEASVSAEASRAKLEFSKTRNSAEYTKLGDSGLSYTLHVENTGSQASYGLEYVEDAFADQNGNGTVSYFSPENMERMFRESYALDPKARLRFTIQKAAIYGWNGDDTADTDTDANAISVYGNPLPVEAKDADTSESKGLNRYNSGTRTPKGKGTITITYHPAASDPNAPEASGPYSVTYQPEEGEAQTLSGSSIRELLEKLHYYVTAEDGYAARWDFSPQSALSKGTAEGGNANTENGNETAGTGNGDAASVELYRFDGGKVLDLPVYASNKTTLQLLPQDTAGSYQGTMDFSLPFSNKGTMQAWEKKNDSSSYEANSPVDRIVTYYVSKELSLSKKGADAGRVTKASGSNNGNNNYLRMPVMEYEAAAENSGTLSYGVLPMEDTLRGSQALLAPYERNKNDSQFSNCPVITVKKDDGTEEEYYVLTEGIYHNIYLGGLKTNSGSGTMPCLADSVTVTKGDSEIQVGDPEYMESLAGKKKIDYSSAVRWNLDSLPADASRAILYDAVGIGFTAEGLALRNFGYSNTVYLNALKGAGEDGKEANDRLFAKMNDTGEGIGSSYSMGKSIVSQPGTGGSHSGEVLDADGYSRINARDNSVFYKLSISYDPAEEGQSVTFKGSEIYGCLPKTYGLFEWKMGNEGGIGTEGNVSVEIVKSDEEKVTLSENFESGISVQNRKPDDKADSGTFQYLRWADDAQVTLTGKCGLDIYVTLTYASSNWEAYCKAAKGDMLVNTFYVCGKPASVTHDLVFENQAYLQKGVNYVYDLADTGKRTAYANGDYAYVEYYAVVYNGGYSKLYLADLIDELPAGFSFYSVDAGANAYAAKKGKGNTSCVTAYSTTGDKAPAIIKDSSLGEGNLPVYKAANIKADPSADGKAVAFHISGNKNNGNFISYDEAAAQSDGEDAAWYLGRGEAVAFTYTLKADREYGKTKDPARNQIYMIFNDPSGAGISRYEFREGDGVTGVARSGIDFNDGSCGDFDGKRGLVSWVDLERGEIIPGIQQTRVSYTAGNVTEEIESGGVIDKGTSSVSWQIDAKNQGSQEINDYTLTDTVDLPLQPYGKVSYAVYDSNGKERVAAYANESTPASFLFEITHISDTEVTILDLKGKEHVIPCTIIGSTGKEEKKGKAGEISLPLVKYSYGNSGGSEMKKDQAIKLSFVKTYADAAMQKGTVSMKLSFSEGVMAVPPAGYGRLDVQTIPVGGLAGGQYTNRADFDPDRAYRTAGDGLNLGDFVRDSAQIASTNDGNTSSIKRVTEMQESMATENTGNSDPDPGRGESSTITLADASNEFLYTMEVTNNISQNMAKLVLVDNLPDVKKENDHYTLQANEPRYSEFQVDFADDPDVKVYIGEDELDKDRFTVEYSTKTVFTDEDLEGEASDDWANANIPPKNARSIRIIITEPIPDGKTVKASFHAKVSGEREDGLLMDHGWIQANQGKTAYNSFAYWYAVEGRFSLRAGTELVGVRLPSFPQLAKQVMNRMDEPVTDSSSFRFVICQGGKDTSDPIPDEAKNFGSLQNGDINVVRTTKDGESLQYLQIQLAAGQDPKDLYAYGFWQNGANYTIEEIPDGGRYQPRGWKLDTGSAVASGDGYLTFKYDGSGQQGITAKNQDAQWKLEITKVRSTDHNTKLSGAWFALYSKAEPGNGGLKFVDGNNSMEAEPVGTEGDAERIYKNKEGGGIPAGDLSAPAEYVDTANTTWYFIGAKATDKDGLASWAGLTEDLYLFHEIKAPDGYKVSEEGYTAVSPESTGTVQTTAKKTVENSYASHHIKIQKTDMAEKPLAGAEFMLYSDPELKTPATDIETKEPVGKIAVDKDGMADLGKLAVRTYYLVETKAPDGYNMLPEPVEITVKLEDDELDAAIIQGVVYNDHTVSADSQQGITLEKDADGGIVYTLKIHNSAGSGLPSSGGTGTASFTILGAALMLASGAGWLARKRRKPV